MSNIEDRSRNSSPNFYFFLKKSCFQTHISKQSKDFTFGEMFYNRLLLQVSSGYQGKCYGWKGMLQNVLLELQTSKQNQFLTGSANAGY